MEYLESDPREVEVWCCLLPDFSTCKDFGNLAVLLVPNVINRA